MNDQLVDRLESKLAQWTAWVITRHRPDGRFDDLVLRGEGDRVWVENTETGDILGLTTKLSLAPGARLHPTSTRDLSAAEVSSVTLDGDR